MMGQFKWTSLFFVAALLGCERAEDPSLTASDVTVMEGNDVHPISFQVSLSDPAPRDVTFDYTTAEITAEAGSDYTHVSGTATIPKGQSSVEIQLEVLGDDIAEQDESFWISYSNGENVKIPNPFNTISILNDDDGFSTSDSGYTSPLTYPGRSLVWADEFNGSSLDLSSWNYETGASGWGNNELQFYREGSSNLEVDHGFLIITAKEESFGGAPYTSARITTKDKQEFQFGRVDIRARLPYGQGVWPALWMLGASFPDVPWPACGEIDIMELLGHKPEEVHATAHWGQAGWSYSIFSTGTYSLPSGQGDFSDAFHVFSLEWEQDLMRFYVDDNLIHTINKSMVSPQEYRHNAPFFFIFNIAVGGNWPGNPDATTTFPQYMAVDYIRVFQ